MNMDKLPFLFVNDVSTLPTEHDFVLKVKKGIQSEADLLSHYELEGNFPGYFGRNWDALLDCLRDFSWASQKRIIIAHQDLPLENDVEGLRIYLDILETAINDWKEIREGPSFVPLDGVPFVKHELLVVFPSAVESRIARMGL
jgi:hypothetical protein